MVKRDNSINTKETDKVRALLKARANKLIQSNIINKVLTAGSFKGNHLGGEYVCEFDYGLGSHNYKGRYPELEIRNRQSGLWGIYNNLSIDWYGQEVLRATKDICAFGIPSSIPLPNIILDKKGHLEDHFWITCYRTGKWEELIEEDILSLNNHMGREGKKRFPLGHNYLPDRYVQNTKNLREIATMHIDSEILEKIGECFGADNLVERPGYYGI